MEKIMFQIRTIILTDRYRVFTEIQQIRQFVEIKTNGTSIAQ